jgi:DNA-binding SARP family transcriptional activator
LLTRLAPPAQQTRLLRRQRVETLLAAALDHPLCLVIAPAGSGKTTALAALAAHGGWPAAWCRARAGDDPPLFLRHLAAAFRAVAPVDEARIAAALARDPANLAPALDILANELAAALNDETLLVIDDYHLADDHPELRALIERLIAILPLRLHLTLVARAEPALAAVNSTRIRGELLLVGPGELSFDPEEARALWALAGQEPPGSLAALVEASRGWPLALQGALAQPDWRSAFGLAGPAPLDGYLAKEVLAELPADLQRFLLQSAGLRQLLPDLCILVADGVAPEPRIAELERRRLFLERDDHGVAFLQPIFRAFLERYARQHLPAWPELHRRAAWYFRRLDDPDGVMYHLLMLGDERQAAETLVEFAPTLLASGRADQLFTWISRLHHTARSSPSLLEVQATALRHVGRFEEALQVFVAANDGYAAIGDVDGQVRSLRGQAQVYLDTVQPVHATDLLKRALKLLPAAQTAERAALLRLQAENWANRGRANVALILERAARQLVDDHEPKREGDKEGATGSRSSDRPPPESLFPPRLLLRAGRLNEARQQLEAQLWAETATPSLDPPSAHREPLLLLSLIYAFLGSGTRSLAMARRGLVESQQLGSRITEAIAEMRLGHAYQLIAPGDLSPAVQRYATAMRLIHSAGVTRTRAESYLGLTLLYGHSGDLPRAEADAREGLQLAAVAGDEWTAALLFLALGGSAVAAGDQRAADWLEQARLRFARGGDTYGIALTTLWRAISALRAGQIADADAEIRALLEAVATYGYVGVLVGPSLFGPRDMATLVPLLLRARALDGYAETARLLLRQGFPTIAGDDTVEDYHPGYTLRVQMLGTFRVWRGAQEIQAREWQREKARQLFQLLLTHRGHWVQREQICAWLWPDADLDAAERQFKVTLNALNAALEPSRPPRVAPFFVRRQGLAYSFAPSYGVWIDVDEFELRVAGTAARDDPEFARRNAQIAVQLYRGDYLAESLYDLWTIEERERLIARYLNTAVSYAQRLNDDGEHAQAVQLCERVLRHDRVYEEAYQILMRAHARAGSRSQALRSYTRCVQALRSDLAIEPLPETVDLYEQVKRNESM